MSDILGLFKKTGALLHGHFILRSGLHSREFFQCALLLQDAPVAAQVCGELAEKLRPFHMEVEGKKPTIISPAVGGIIVGQEVARHLGTRHIFVEKDGNGGLVMRRFEIVPGERFLVAEDVVTRGGCVPLAESSWQSVRLWIVAGVIFPTSERLLSALCR
jgi:orotate phosphoribosyltransferase